jgi:hypothetical protein
MHTRFNCHVPENEGAQQNESACAKKHVSSSLRVDGSDKSLKHGCLCPMRRNVATVQSRETQTTCTCSNNAWLETLLLPHTGGWCCFEPREQGMWGSFDCLMHAAPFHSASLEWCIHRLLSCCHQLVVCVFDSQLECGGREGPVL